MKKLLIYSLALCAIACLSGCEAMPNVTGSLTYNPDTGLTIGGHLPPTTGYAK